MDKIGVVYWDENHRLLLLLPEEGRATEISDPHNVYADMLEETMDVVSVEVPDPSQPAHLAMRSIRKMGWMKPPKGLQLTDAQMTEFPTKAHECVEYIMVDEGRRATFIELLKDDSNS